MPDQPTNHRTQAAEWLELAAQAYTAADEVAEHEAIRVEYAKATALIGIGHALLAGQTPHPGSMADFAGLVTRTFAGEPIALSPSQAEALERLIHDRNHPYGEKPADA